VNTDILALVKDIQDRVREVAYLMWESAGRHHGMAMEYWLQAEREVITTMQGAAERMMPGQAPGADAPAEAAPVSQTSAPVVEASQEAAKALSAPSAPEAAAAPATAEAEPVSQASDAVVEATPAVAEASAAAGSTAAAAKAAAKPTRKAGTRAKRIPPPAS